MDEPSLLFIQTLIERLIEGQRRTEVKRDRLIDDVSDLRIRMTAVGEANARLNRRPDRIEGRLDQIERRLDLVPAVQ